METKDAIAGFGALAQESRLEVFRLLVRAGDEGLPAGAIARALAVPHNTMSSHLGILAQAGLVSSRREGRSIIYTIDFTGVRALLSFLMEDCCQGAPEVCAPAIAGILGDAACAPSKPPRRST